MGQRLGVYGGTFDPVHFGHLRPALEIAAALDLDEVRLIPCHQSPHRDAPVVGDAHRLAMLRCAVAAGGPFAIDDRELRRAGPSYSVDTLAELRAERPEARLLLFLGGDAFAGFPRWHRWAEILELAHLVISPRPASRAANRAADLAGSELPEDAAALLAGRRAACAAQLDAQPAGRIFVQPVTQLDISATQIRALLAAGGDPAYLMPLAVRDYIQQHGLYRPQPSQR